MAALAVALDEPVALPTEEALESFKRSTAMGEYYRNLSANYHYHSNKENPIPWPNPPYPPASYYGDEDLPSF